MTKQVKTTALVNGVEQLAELMPSRQRKRAPGAGRKKGVPNKLSATAKENIEAVFNGLGGADAMLGFFRGDDLPSLDDINAKGDEQGWSIREKLRHAMALAASVEERKLIFYARIYPKLLPIQLTGKDGAPLTVQFVVDKGDDGI